MTALKIFICAAFWAVLSIQSADTSLIFRQIEDLETNNNTLDYSGVETIETHIQLIGENQNEALDQTELTQNVGVTKYYSLGKRIAGDRVVATGGKAMNWSTPHNVKITLAYPTRGIGALVTYVFIAVDQTNNGGRAYVLNGGVNQRHITVVIEAFGVTHFALAASIYGR
uniref:Venom polypeptide n=1 Tax=Dolopus genitalis TaxID=2488630 RepID=A0A3G5BIF1_DOLGE|nr:venom polypeptide [Dolopus genitalis]